MYICYIDESGTSELNDGIHYALVGIAIPAELWQNCSREIKEVKRRHWLGDSELHTAWMLKDYNEQRRIKDFEKLSHIDRRKAVERELKKSLVLATTKGHKKVKAKQKEIRKITSYIHLTRDERLNCLNDLCDLIGGWGYCRIFGDAINKKEFKGKPPKYPPYEEAFGQLVTRFERFLKSEETMGMMVYDNNPSLSYRLTELMRRYHSIGTMFTEIENIIETPFFVDSALTEMIQIADICAYATRRFCDKNEGNLFHRIYSRINRDGGRLVGLRHYVKDVSCYCQICQSH